MKPINVVVVTPAFDKSLPRATPETLRQISLVSPDITVSDASALVAAEFRGDDSASEKLNTILTRADVIYGLIPPRDLLKRAPRLKWVQMMSAGVDRLRDTEIWRSGIIITGVSGIHATPIGEFVLELMLMFAKGAPLCSLQKQQREWRRFLPTVLRGKTVGIVGLGHIGREVARLSKAFGMKVIATRRSVKKEGRARYVDLLLPARELPSLLKDSDFVVICTPHTPETHHLISEREFSLMKPTAYIINIARGGIIDEAALIKALDEKRIAGAGLDVVEKEPLPPASRLWDFPNVILSPHVAGGHEDYMVRATALFCENLKRYLAGKRLLNVINREKGY
jgi:phosphoglycerate dehydrogenase-like enzyme